MQHIVIDPSGALPGALQAYLVPDTRDAIESAVDALIARLDGMDGDPDTEPNGDELDGNSAEDDFMEHASTFAGPGCSVADEDAVSAPEWHTLGRHKARTYGGPLPHEDVEEDDGDTGVEDHPLGFDPEEDMCEAGDDRVTSGAVIQRYHQGKYDGPGDADDAEYDEMNMPDSVPMLPVYAIEPNPFDGKREYLGHSNLQASFVSGQPMKGAD